MVLIDPVKTISPAGDIVLTGSISTTCWPIVGDKVEANIDMLNSVSFNTDSI